MAKSSFYSGSQQVSANSNAVEDSKNAAALSEAAAAASAAASATSAASGAASATTATTKASESAASATASATSASASQVSRVASEVAKVASEAAKTAAETARDAAAASSTSASSSQAAASTSEANAATSAAAALVSENAAAASAATATTEASDSATSAAASEVSNVASGVAKVAAETAETNAATSETNAATSETNAATSETNAATSETNAATSATAAASSASAASSSATSASNAQTAAESARDATLTAYDNFDDRYLGAKSSAPTVDNDGNALVAGSLYFDTVSGAMRVYTGSAWVAAYVNGADYLALSGGTMTGDVAYGDNDKATFGASADLQVFHDGSNSIIKDTGAGNLYLQGSSNIVLESATTGDNYIVCTDGASVNLYYDNEVKLATTANGVRINDGTLYIEDPTGYANIEMGGPSGAYVDFKTPYSDDYDTRMVYNGTAFVIETNADEPIVLKHNSSEKMRTTSTGIDVTGTVVADGAAIGESTANTTLTVGGSYANGLEIAQNGIDATSSARLFFDSTTDTSAIYNSSGDLTIAKAATINGSSGNKSMTLASNGDISFYEDTGTTAKLVWDASDEALEFGDNVKAKFGAGSDLQIYHTGSTSYIYEQGTGDLRIRGNEVRIEDGDGSTIALFQNNAGAQLRHNGTTVLNTDATGIDVTGTVVADKLTIGTTAQSSLFYLYGVPQATSGALATFRDSNATSSNTSFGSLVFSSSPGTDYAIGKSNVNTASTLSFRNANTGTSYVDIDSSGNLEMTGGGSVGWANFTFKEESGYLYVYNGSTKIMRVDASGNAAFAGDVEANATL